MWQTVESPLKLSHLKMLSSHFCREFLTYLKNLAFWNKFCNEELDAHLPSLFFNSKWQVQNKDISIPLILWSGGTRIAPRSWEKKCGS